MIEYNYEYDLANHPYRSEFLDEESGVLQQSLCTPEGVDSVRGLRVRLSRYGDPGPLRLLPRPERMGSECWRTA